jgi:hypothetical protein
MRPVPLQVGKGLGHTLLMTHPILTVGRPAAPVTKGAQLPSVHKTQLAPA